MNEHRLSVAAARYGAQRSRRLLVAMIDVLGAHAGALTVVGAHAVHAWVQNKWGPIDMESTRDGDVVLNPTFVGSDPNIVATMADAGVVPVDQRAHPGIYGYEAELGRDWRERATIDLIVPETYAGRGRRSAEIAGQDRAALRARGLELALHDRHLMTLATMDDQPTEHVAAHVAGPAALLVAKAHKVSERAANEARPDRLRPKDSGDVALLMMVSDPVEIAGIMRRRSAEHLEIAEIVREGAEALIALYSPENDSVSRSHMASGLASRFSEEDVLEATDRWVGTFARAWQGAREAQGS